MTRRIEICGGIASGKTTLAKLFAMQDHELVLENFRTNPYWENFYKNPKRYAFETEITFLLQHYSQFLDAHETRRMSVCDSSLVQDLAYADLNLNAGPRSAFDAVFREAEAALPEPTLIIHLGCSANEQLKRIQMRARPEERSITHEYLDALNRALACRIDHLRKTENIVDIDSEAINFAEIEHDKKNVIEKILGAL